MKYKLEPDNRNCSDEVLLEDLRLVAQSLGRTTLAKDDYNKHGRFSSSTIQTRFATWNSALERSGLSVQKRVDIPADELLQDLRRVAETLGTNSVPQKVYLSRGTFSYKTITKRFGSWAKAVEVAGLNRAPLRTPQKISDDELFSNMAAVWESVGGQPKQKDFCHPISRFSDSPYTRRFGSWRKALEVFVEAANKHVNEELEIAEKKVQTPKLRTLNIVAFNAQPDPPKRRRTPRDPGWRLRFLVLRRDRFTCQFCGRTPALHPGLVLDVDHIDAWSKGGETTMDNLQTLCHRCNGGKSDLAMQD